MTKCIRFVIAVMILPFYIVAMGLIALIECLSDDTDWVFYKAWFFDGFVWQSLAWK